MSEPGNVGGMDSGPDRPADRPPGWLSLGIVVAFTTGLAVYAGMPVLGVMAMAAYGFLMWIRHG